MKLYNTLSRKVEEFKPIEDRKVRLYACGPTVYDSAHIGNLRTYLFEDFLKRTLLNAGYEVNHVMNITDVDDKTIKQSGGDKTKLIDSTRQIEKKFLSDLEKLNILPASKLTRATEYIEQMVELVKELMEKEYAYKAEDGSIYFSVEKFKDYGKLSKIDLVGNKSGARVAQDEYDKENPADFALWKAWNNEDGDVYWDPSTWLEAGTEIPKGRPGWHIECSAMSQDALGETIDIHAGAVDLIFPHHENEIAQSEARTGKEFCRYWIHGEHLLVDGEKMSKSLHNLYTLNDIAEKNFSPLDFRYLVLGAHYRTKLNFSWDSLTAARNARERLMRLLVGMSETLGEIDQKYYSEFKSKVEDDLDTPGGLAVLWEMIRDEKLDSGSKLATVKEMDKVLGLDLGKQEEIVLPEEVVQIAETRKEAREKKDFAISDKLRDEILEKGFLIEDLPGNEYKIVKK